MLSRVTVGQWVRKSLRTLIVVWVFLLGCSRERGVVGEGVLMDRPGLCKHLLTVHLSSHVAAHFNHMHTPLYIGQSWVLPKSSPRIYSFPLHIHTFKPVQARSAHLFWFCNMFWDMFGMGWYQGVAKGSNLFPFSKAGIYVVRCIWGSQVVDSF